MSQPSTPALQPTYMKVFIQRDYSDGTSVKFQTRFPPELEGRVNIFMPCIDVHTKEWQMFSVLFLCWCWFFFIIFFWIFIRIKIWLFHRIQIERQQFEVTINKLNEYFAEAEKGSCSTYWWVCRECMLEWLINWVLQLFYLQWGMFGMYHRLLSIFVYRNTLRKGKITFWLISNTPKHIACNLICLCYLFLTHFFFLFHCLLQCIRKVSKYIAQQNERIYNPKGLQITDPTYRGLRVIEISILDRPGRTWLPLSHSTEEFFM